ncbi:Decarboxylase yanB [Colletotrichum orbiculare MAFF 240422]|uniref:6-methylsalicylate decarboxylase n=1 Tax=Colletotrichum orbiculare (strain 104-T / ATCC 96160 / CBS 514.97 / LARS 414 / MAFF 240422) TaxID=1213857 RepID=N4VTC1_COLOR|nr:Decarboxylase yanB [Colletotrichum orbiculare MAFF 240422]
MLDRIDTHIHALPPAYVAAVMAAGGDPSGFASPEWSFDGTIKSMNATDTSLAILSVSAPGASIAGTGEAGRKLARSINTYLGEQTTGSQSDGRLGFFGALPDWNDVEGAVAELDFLYRQQKLCFGVTVFTSYGVKLLGHASFKPIWKRLQGYKALVFTHPTLFDVTPRFIASNLPQPVVDYALATTRMAVDLVLGGTLHACPDVDVVLSHAGGTLPFLAGRIGGTLKIPSVESAVAVSQETAGVGFARFYYDTALSTSAAQLGGLLDSADPLHVLFGSDFPYCTQDVVDGQIEIYDSFVAKDPRGSLVSPGALRRNSMTLLQKHCQAHELDWEFKAAGRTKSKL